MTYFIPETEPVQTFGTPEQANRKAWELHVKHNCYVRVLDGNSPTYDRRLWRETRAASGNWGKRTEERLDRACAGLLQASI